MSQRNAPPRRIVHGTFIHSISLLEIEYIQNGLLAISAAGVIAWFDRSVPPSAVDARIRERGWEGAQVVRMNKGEFIIPGLVDTHTHAPQFANIGFGQQYELLDWLTEVTFPTEAKFADARYAKKRYEDVVRRVINSGTTTCCYYGTLHPTTKILALTTHRQGQRAFVGKCNMDRNSIPTYTEGSASTSIADTKAFITYVRTHCLSPTPIAAFDGTLPIIKDASYEPRSPIARSARSIALAAEGAIKKPRADSPSNRKLSKNLYSPTSLVQPILTPRFAISCTDELLTELGKMLDKDPSLALQTHLAENPAEILLTKSLYPDLETYTAVYDHFKLLRSNTILAHCTHLEPSELDLIKENNSGISHCPTSNFNLRSGMADLGAMLDRQIKVSLGTDNSGGFGMGILSAIRNASICSKVLAVQRRDTPSPPPIDLLADSFSTTTIDPPLIASEPVAVGEAESTPSKHFSENYLGLETLFYLATMGGAEVVNLDKRIGNFVVGKEFDALLVRTGLVDSALVVDGAALDGDEDEDEDDEDEDDGEWENPKKVEGNPGMIVEEDDSIEMLFEKFLFTGDDRNIGTVFVRGRIIGGNSPIHSS